MPVWDRQGMVTAGTEKCCHVWKNGFALKVPIGPERIALVAHEHSVLLGSTNTNANCIATKTAEADIAHGSHGTHG